MGDKRRKKRKSNSFNFAPPHHPQAIIAHLADLLNQHRSHTGSDMPNPPERSLLRRAIHDRDSTKLRRLLRDGVDVNTVIDDVYRDTPLTYAIKCGFLEIVELLVRSPKCCLQKKTTDKHGVLDEAVRSWLTEAQASHAGDATSGQRVGRRFRILRCLLAAGAANLNAGLMDVLLFSRLNDKQGLALVAKLVQVFCDRGCQRARSALLSVLVSYKHTCPLVSNLLMSGARPDMILIKRPAHAFLPLDNAILLVRACNHSALLDKIERDTTGPQHSTHSRHQQHNNHPQQQQGNAKRWELIRLLTTSGHIIRLSTMSYVYRNHAGLYVWVTSYCRQPRRLGDMARVAARREMQPNVLAALARTQALPDSVKQFLLLET